MTVSNKSVLLLLPLLMIVASACSRDPGSKPAAGASEPLRETDIPIEVVHVVSKVMERTVDVVGTLLPYDEVQVASEVPGAIQKIFADFGDRVVKGQKLIQLDPREYDLQVDQAQAQVAVSAQMLERARVAVETARVAVETARAEERAAMAQVERSDSLVTDAKTNLERMRKLHTEGVVARVELDTGLTKYDTALASLRAAEAERQSRLSRVRSAAAQLDEAQAQVKVAEAGLRQAEAAVAVLRKRAADTLIHAPLSGEVKERLVAVGQVVKEREPLMSVVAINPIILEGEVAERYVARVRAGAQVRLRVDPYPGEQFVGKVARIRPAAKEESRSVAMRAYFANDSGRLKPGLFARATIVTGSEPVLLVPERALVTVVGINKLFVLKEDGRTVEARQVKTGVTTDGMIEIPEGVKAGEKVAVSALSRLSDGAKVRLSPKGEGAE